MTCLHDEVLDDPNLKPSPTFSVGYVDPDTGDFIIYREGITEMEADAAIAKDKRHGFHSFKRKEVMHEAA